MGLFDKLFSKSKVDPAEYQQKLNEAVEIGKEIQSLCEKWHGRFHIVWYSQCAEMYMNNKNFDMVEFENRTSQRIRYDVRMEAYDKYNFEFYNNNFGVYGKADECEESKIQFLEHSYKKPYSEIPEILRTLIKGDIVDDELHCSFYCSLPSGMQGEKDCEKFIRDIKSRLGI